MTVNRPGRPSKANERIAEILAATTQVVAREGLSGATFAKIAAAAGMQRTLVLHYFGSRDELISAFIAHTMSAVGTEILRRHGARPLRESVAMFFEPGAYRTEEELIVWTELVAMSAREPEVRRHMHDLWTRRWLPELESQLAHEFPGTDSEQIATTAYALACLFEAHWAFSQQGVADDRRTHQAQSAAEQLLRRLTD